MVMVAVPLEDSEQAQGLLAVILWTTASIVIALTLAIGFGAGILAQPRIAQINGTLSRLADGDLSAPAERLIAQDDLDNIARHLDVTTAELERLVSQSHKLQVFLTCAATSLPDGHPKIDLN